MAINSVNDPGFLAQLSQQASARTPLANKRAANAAIGAGRSGASAQIPVAMQTQNPYFLNPSANPAMQQPMGALGPGASTPPLPANPASRALVPVGQQALPAGPQPTAALGPGPRALPPGGGLVDDVARAAASPADDLLSQATGAGNAAGKARNVATAGRAAGAMQTAGTASTVIQNAPKMGQMFANVTKGTLMRGAGVAGVGYALSGVMDGMNIGGENSNADQGISGGILGAGIGAGGAMALGLGAGPIGWAALGGAALFAGGKMLFGNNKNTSQQMTEAADKTRATIEQLSGLYGLDADATSELMMQYDVSTRLYQDNKDKEGLKNYLTGLSSTLPALMLQQKEQADMEAQEQQRFEGMLATQAQFAPIFDQALNQAQQASAGAMETANEISHRLAVSAPNLSNLVRSGAATSNANANRLYAGYAAQMAMGPQANYNMNNLADLQAQVEQQQLLDQYMQSAGG